MMKGLVLIGLGSCVGGIARYLTQVFMQKNFPSSFPMGTLTVNILGCFFIGIIYALAGKGNLLSPEMRLLLATGFCGGFTTFSSYAYENVGLLQDGEFLYMGLYVVLSNLIGLAAVYLGILFVKFLG